MDNEVTRTGNADRERYANHLPALHAEGYISMEELDTMTGRVLRASTLRELDGIMAGFPKPPEPRRPRDWGIPSNFLPLTAVGSIVGITIAVVPTAALSGHNSSLAAVATGLALAWGIWIVIVAVVAAVVAAVTWDDLDCYDKKQRRVRDRQGR